MSAAGEKLYKVLVDGKPCHGGDPSFAWPLPRAGRPGRWLKIKGPLVLCDRALHLTSEPRNWYVAGSQVYEAEIRGESVRHGEKVGALEARLLVQSHWSQHGVYVFGDGHHVISEGLAVLSGQARATLSGQATVTLYDQATATLSGQATATLSGQATATLYDQATAISSPFHSQSADVAISQMAAHVDRRDGNLVLRCARGSLTLTASGDFATAEQPA